LKEAVKCWFCQAVFESENDQNEPIDKQGEIAQNEKEHFQDQEAQSGEDIPEWLKKVRALKAADQPKEEEKPDWEQHDLFPTSDEPKRSRLNKQSLKKAKKKIARIKIPDQEKQLDMEEKGVLKDNKDLASTTSTDHKDEPDTFSDELPEGFTKI